MAHTATTRVIRLKKHYDATRERSENVIGKKIAMARAANGLTLKQLASVLENFGLDISDRGINKWEKGDSLPNAYQLIAVSLALGIVNVTELCESYQPELNEEGLAKLREYKNDLIASGRYVPVKEVSEIEYINMRISDLPASAGLGNYLTEEHFTIVPFPKDYVPSGADFGIRVSGDSMESVFHDGQLVWIRECEELEPGQVGLFILNGSGYIKEYQVQAPGDNVRDDYTDSVGCVHQQPVLISYNNAYDPIVINPDSTFQIVGRVVG